MPEGTTKCMPQLHRGGGALLDREGNPPKCGCKKLSERGPKVHCRDTAERGLSFGPFVLGNHSAPPRGLLVRSTLDSPKQRACRPTSQKHAN